MKALFLATALAFGFVLAGGTGGTDSTSNQSEVLDIAGGTGGTDSTSNQSEVLDIA